MRTSSITSVALEVRRTPFVELFRTTPALTVCPNFYVLAHANGCAFSPACAYCYLKSTFWHLKRPRVYTNTGPMLEEVRRWIGRDGLESYLLNAGNLSDSLVFEGVRPLVGSLVELFRAESERKGRPHTLLLVTKAGPASCRALLERSPSSRVILAFSINSPQAAAAYEAGTPPAEERLQAARLLREAGWRVRIRIDPIIAGSDYAPLARQVRDLQPERVTLGCLRAERSLPRFIGNREVLTGLVPALEPRGLARYPEQLRLSLYRQLTTVLAGRIPLGLCEETAEVWEALGLDSRVPCCSCGL